MNTYISAKASQKVWGYVEAVNTEIGGFGYAYMEDGDLVWDDTFLVPQIATKGEVDFEATNGDEAAIEKAAKDGVLGQDNFVWVSWHSHHNMQAFWSKTDEERIEGLSKTGIKMLLSFVGCHDHKYRLRLDLFDVGHHGVVVPHVTMGDLALLNDARDAVFAEVYDDIKANLRKPAPKVTKTGKLPAVRQDDPGEALERVLTIKQLMDAGLSKSAAEAHWDSLVDEEENGFEIVNGELVAPDGFEVVSVGGFDDMAWGD